MFDMVVSDITFFHKETAMSDKEKLEEIARKLEEIARQIKELLKG